MDITKKLILHLVLFLSLVCFDKRMKAQSYVVKGGYPPEEFEGGIFIGTGAKLVSTDTIIVEGPDSTIQATWKDYTGVSLSGNTLIKTASAGWGNAGAFSYNQLKSLQNGWISHKITNVTTDYKLGLSRDTTTAFDSIDYAVRVNLGQVSVYNRNTFVGIFDTVIVGDSIQIERIGNVIAYTKNHIIFYNQEANAKEKLQINVSQYTTGTPTLITCSFGIGSLFRPYSVLRKKLDGGFYLPILHKLYFKFEEEYKDGTLTYQVINNSTGIATPTIPINTSVKNYGDNRYELNLAGTLTPSGTYYTLVAKNEKNVSYYLRFKY